MTVFHPGHDALHGFTTLLLSNGAETWVGRWDAMDDSGVWLNDVEVHVEGESPLSKAEFLDRVAMLGPKPNLSRCYVPKAAVVEVHRLGDWKRARRT